ncbi:histone deacetylase 6-like [Adelges cooleyi]|uniref:histone deacetylase 6-like n=1 Tax=Adelges cooleyi TaxID=133065 RepID=UPI00217FD338|nr:histone deacetylase 6-like [Adelges cooleyi]
MENHNKVKLSTADLIAARKKEYLQTDLSKCKLYDQVQDNYKISRQCINQICQKTGIVYDDNFAVHSCTWDVNYPENPQRYDSIIKRCKELGLIERCVQIECRMASNGELLLKHTQKIIDLLKSTAGSTDADNLENLSSKFDAVYIHPATYKQSLYATGSSIELLRAICEHKIQNGMAFIRPPGHHAMKSEFCGYCFFNNVAIAVEYCLRLYSVEKILIVDWDVHHGQATQQMFYDDPRVLYFSIHRYENGQFWPNLRESDWDYTGQGDGQGFNINVPLNTTGMKDSDYLAIINHILLPVASEFQPDVIVISSGYDAALGCPEGEMEVTPACYAHMINALMAHACGRIAVFLEGGYCLKSLAEGAALTLRGLLGDPCPLLDKTVKPCDSVVETIQNVIYAHQRFWKCFQNEFLINQSYKPISMYSYDEQPPSVFPTRNCYPTQDMSKIDEFSVLHHLISETRLLNIKNKCCIAFDLIMDRKHESSESGHPECPGRISAILNMFKTFNLTSRLLVLPSREAIVNELLLAHDKEYVDDISKLNMLSSAELTEKENSYDSIYLTPDTYKVSTLATGCLLQVIDSVMSNESASGVAVIRPPGHHAEKELACGFCIFNSVAVGANYALQKYGLKRILILDWDIHFGNGTMRAFSSDPRVLYISIHRYQNAKFFPCSEEGSHRVAGYGEGEGFTINIPWNKAGMGDAEYISVMQNLILPVAYEFCPELVLVSAGFDAAIGDPLGGCKVTPECFGHLTHCLKSLASGKVILALEGGYNIDAVSYCMTMCTKALLGDPLPSLQLEFPIGKTAQNTMKRVVNIHKHYWACFNCFNYDRSKSLKYNN